MIALPVRTILTFDWRFVGSYCPLIRKSGVLPVKKRARYPASGHRNASDKRRRQPVLSNPFVNSSFKDRKANPAPGQTPRTVRLSAYPFSASRRGSKARCGSVPRKPSSAGKPPLGALPSPEPGRAALPPLTPRPAAEHRRPAPAAATPSGGGGGGAPAAPPTPGPPPREPPALPQPSQTGRCVAGRGGPGFAGGSGHRSPSRTGGPRPAAWRLCRRRFPPGRPAPPRPAARLGARSAAHLGSARLSAVRPRSGLKGRGGAVAGPAPPRSSGPVGRHRAQPHPRCLTASRLEAEPSPSRVREAPWRLLEHPSARGPRVWLPAEGDRRCPGCRRG